ncbi:hypothetical protein [Bartonella sp. AA23NXGY]
MINGKLVEYRYFYTYEGSSRHHHYNYSLFSMTATILSTLGGSL